MGDIITFYTIHCPMCKNIQKQMDNKKISYQVIDDKSLVLKKADELNVSEAPFAIINGEFYDNKRLKKWVEEYAI